MLGPAALRSAPRGLLDRVEHLRLLCVRAVRLREVVQAFGIRVRIADFQTQEFVGIRAHGYAALDLAQQYAVAIGAGKIGQQGGVSIEGGQPIVSGVELVGARLLQVDGNLRDAGPQVLRQEFFLQFGFA